MFFEGENRAQDLLLGMCSRLTHGSAQATIGDSRDQNKSVLDNASDLPIVLSLRVITVYFLRKKSRLKYKSKLLPV